MSGFFLARDIVVYERDGANVSIDNRRLYIYQEAGKPIQTIPAKVGDVAPWTFKNTHIDNLDGNVTIKVREPKK